MSAITNLIEVTEMGRKLSTTLKMAKIRLFACFCGNFNEVTLGRSSYQQEGKIDIVKDLMF